MKGMLSARLLVARGGDTASRSQRCWLPCGRSGGSAKKSGANEKIERAHVSLSRASPKLLAEDPNKAKAAYFEIFALRCRLPDEIEYTALFVRYTIRVPTGLGIALMGLGAGARTSGATAQSRPDARADLNSLAGARSVVVSNWSWRGSTERSARQVPAEAAKLFAVSALRRCSSSRSGSWSADLGGRTEKRVPYAADLIVGARLHLSTCGSRRSTARVW